MDGIQFCQNEPFCSPGSRNTAVTLKFLTTFTPLIFTHAPIRDEGVERLGPFSYSRYRTSKEVKKKVAIGNCMSE